MLSVKLRRRILRMAYQRLDMPLSTKLHFTFLCERNTILCYGWNDGFKTDPIAKRYELRFNSKHSESSAIRNFPFPPKYLQHCRLVNVRVMKRDWSLGMSKPCKKCQRMLEDFGIHDVWYTDRAGQFVSL